jgi:hypothetical protein
MPWGAPQKCDVIKITRIRRGRRRFGNDNAVDYTNPSLSRVHFAVCRLVKLELQENVAR